MLRHFLRKAGLGRGSQVQSGEALTNDTFQSGMFDSRDPADSGHEVLPASLFGLEHAAPLGGQAVIATAPLVCFLDPFALDPTLCFESVEQRIKGRDMKGQGAAGTESRSAWKCRSRGAGLVIEQRKDQKFGAALFPFGVDSILFCPIYWTQQ